jgi:hypothetical protein
MLTGPLRANRVEGARGANARRQPKAVIARPSRPSTARRRLARRRGAFMNVPVAWALSSGHFGWYSIPRYVMALASEEVPPR